VRNLCGVLEDACNFFPCQIAFLPQAFHDGEDRGPGQAGLGGEMLGRLPHGDGVVIGDVLQDLQFASTDLG